MEITEIADDTGKQSHTLGFEARGWTPEQIAEARAAQGLPVDPQQQIPAARRLVVNDQVSISLQSSPYYAPNVTVGRTVGEILDEMVKLNAEAEALEEAKAQLPEDSPSVSVLQEMIDGKTIQANNILTKLREQRVPL